MWPSIMQVPVKEVWPNMHAKSSEGGVASDKKFFKKERTMKQTDVMSDRRLTVVGVQQAE